MTLSKRFIFAVCAIVLSLGLAACKSAEEQAAEYFASAQGLAEENDFDRAIVALRNVFEFEPTHREARRLMGEIYLNERDNPRQAYGQFLRLAEQHPDDLGARIVLAELAFADTNWDELERHASQAVAIAPEDPRVQPLATARAYRSAVLSNDTVARDATANEARALITDRPDNFVLRSIIIDDLLRGGDLPAALTEIDMLLERSPGNEIYHQQRLNILAQLGDMDALEDQLRIMMAQFPDDPAHAATLLRLYLSSGDLDAAEDFFREQIAQATDDGVTARGDLIRFLAEFRSIEDARAEIAASLDQVEDPLPFLVIDASLDFSTSANPEAMAALEQAITDNPESSQISAAKVTLARMMIASGNEVGARARIEDVIAQDPTNTEALKLRAGWLIADDQIDDAITSLRTALDSSPNDAQAMSLMADAYVRNGRPLLARDFRALAVDASGNAPAETIRYALQLISDESYLAAEDILITSLRLNTDHPDLLLTLGQVYLEMEDFPRAQQVVGTLRRLDTPQMIAAANRVEAELINRQSGSQGALAFLEGLANRSDADLTAQISLVRARIRAGETDAARDLVLEMLETNPDNTDLQFLLGTTQTLAGDLDAAAAQYRSMLEAEPRQPAVWLALSQLAQRQGDRDAAKAIVEDAVDAIPTEPTLLWAKASFLEQDGDTDGAIAIYEDLYAQDSSALVIANNLASMLSTYRDDAESLERAWTVARRFSDTQIAPVQDTYGWILHRRGDSEGALAYLEPAAAALPNDPLAQYHLAQTYAALARPEDALAQFQKVVALAGPGDSRPQIASARQAIQDLLEAAAAPAADE